MALIKKEVIDYWVSPETDLGAFSNGQNRWFSPSDNTLSGSSATVSTGAWLKVDLNGADAFAVQEAFRITAITLGGATTVTACSPFVYAHGIPHVGPEPHDQPPSVESGQARNTPASGPLAAAALACFFPGTDGNFGYAVNDFGAADADHLQHSFFGLIGDGTTPTVNDTTLSTFWLGHPNANVSPITAGVPNNPEPRVSGLDAVWLALGIDMGLATSTITALTVTGSIKIILYDEVDRVQMLNPRASKRRDTRQNVAKI